MELKVKGIARYCHILKPSAPKDTTNFKYSIQILIKKSDPQVKKIQGIVDEAILKGFPKGIPGKFYTFFTDLAIEDPENKELSDYMCLKASTLVEYEVPCFVGEDYTPIIDVHHPVEGKLAWVSGSIGTFDNASKGIKMYLNGVMILNEMGDIPLEKISSKTTPEQMFQGCFGGSTVSPTVAASSPTPPPPLPPVNDGETRFYTMTDKANGMSQESFIKSGWTDEQLIENGYMKVNS